MRATIKDVAKLAGVSTATVSNVITQKKYVSKELEIRIQSAMNTLGYKPNTIARSLKINRSYTIGVTVPNITNPFFAEIVEYIQKKAGKKSYQITLFNSDNDDLKEKRILDFFLSSGVDGIINVAPQSSIEMLDKSSGVPTVIVDRPAFKTANNIGFVYADNFSGAAQVADYLVSQNHKYFACFAGPIETVPNAKKRLDGFTNRLIELGVPKEQCLVYNCNYTFESGYITMQTLLKKRKNCNEKYAVFACSDIMAWGAMEAVKTNGLKIPRDISIVGFDNIFYSNFLYPSLTTVENPTKELGEASIKLLLDSIENEKKLNGTEIILKTTLIERKSSQ